MDFIAIMKEVRKALEATNAEVKVGLLEDNKVGENGMILVDYNPLAVDSYNSPIQPVSVSLRLLAESEDYLDDLLNKTMNEMDGLSIKIDEGNANYFTLTGSVPVFKDPPTNLPSRILTYTCTVQFC